MYWISTQQVLNRHFSNTGEVLSKYWISTELGFWQISQGIPGQVLNKYWISTQQQFGEGIPGYSPPLRETGNTGLSTEDK